MRPPHVEACTPTACALACGFRKFHAWLDEPVTSWDSRDDEVTRRRREAFLRGEI